MDLAHMIYDLSIEAEMLDDRGSDVIIECIHTSVLDDYSCAIPLRLCRCKKKCRNRGDDSWELRYKHATLTFNSLDELLCTESNLYELLCSNILHDFLSLIERESFTEMDYLTLNVYKGGHRLSILPIYFKEELKDYDVSNSIRIHELMYNFRRQIELASKIT